MSATPFPIPVRPAPPLKAGGKPATGLQREAEERQRETEMDISEVSNSVYSSYPVSLSLSVQVTEEEAVVLCVPAGAGGRKAAIFKLARLARHNLDLGYPQARKLCKAWYLRVKSGPLPDEEFERTLKDFSFGFDRARDAVRDLLADAYAWALCSPHPLPPDGMIDEGTNMATLWRVARNMAAAVGESREFWIPCHEFGKVSGISAACVCNCLHAIEELGWLECVRRGKQGGHTATRYVWNWQREAAERDGGVDRGAVQLPDSSP